MGAVLFALRTGGNYPFVAKEEAKARPQNDGAARKRFDKMVRDRASDPKSDSELQERIKDEFPNGSGKLMMAMLQFEAAKRPTADQCAKEWGTHLRPWIPPMPAEEITDIETEFQDTECFLQAFLMGTTEMSSRQWERASAAVDTLEQKLDGAKSSKLIELRRKVAEIRQSAAV